MKLPMFINPSTIPILILFKKVMILGIIECLFFRGPSASPVVPRFNYNPFRQYCNRIAKYLQTFISSPYRCGIMVSEVTVMLFKRKPKNKEPEPTLVLSVPHSDHFRGYKRIGLDAYQDAEADKGIEAVKAADTISEVTFKEYIFPDTPPLLRVYADGHKIGTIWSTSRKEYYKAIKGGRCEKASVAFNDLGNVFLFVKLK